MSRDLAQALDVMSVAGSLWEAAGAGVIRCLACAHRCELRDGAAGACLVRKAANGVLRVPWGYASALLREPVEKKPFYHVLPGAMTMSFATLGCSMSCHFCHNWVVSQTLRDAAAGSDPRPLEAPDVAAAAKRTGASIVAASYNEPLVAAEWCAEVFRAAHVEGLVTACISNGMATPEAIRLLAPHTDLYKVDLKCFTESGYRHLGGELAPVLETIPALREAGVWVEVVTVLLPGVNDSAEELRAAVKFLASVSSDLPWHLLAVHAAYHYHPPIIRLDEPLTQAVEIGREAGLRHVYLHQSPSGNDTICPECRSRVVRRASGRTLESRVTAAGNCPDCGTGIPGRWTMSGILKESVPSLR